MEKQYICPKCDGLLRVGENIIFMAKNKWKKKGLIMLHYEIGNYTSHKNPDFNIEMGERVEFYCPLCNKSLTADFDRNLTHILLQQEGKLYDIYFSKIAGEKSTYVVNEEGVTRAGEHADRYTYFTMKDEYKKYLGR